MLTVVVLMSGVHRLAWLEQALMSIPMDSPLVSAVHLVHQGGVWDWAPALRERVRKMPKVRIVEYPDRVHYVDSFNRSTLDTGSKWAMLLPDDDYLLTARFADALQESSAALASDCGFIGYGWYYLRCNRFVADHVRKYDVSHVQRFTPKFCTTLVNVDRFRQLGGFSKAYGGFCDSVLYARLAYEYNAWVSPTPVGVFRMHETQASKNIESMYLPYLEATVDTLVSLSGEASARSGLTQQINSFLGQSSAGRIARSLDRLKLAVRGSVTPPTARLRPPILLPLVR